MSSTWRWQGYDKAGIPGTAVGPLKHPETWCKGIDDLEKRAAEAYAQGARFAKWRNVLQIDPAQGLPSDLAITLCVNNLAQVSHPCTPKLRWRISLRESVVTAKQCELVVLSRARLLSRSMR